MGHAQGFLMEKAPGRSFMRPSGTHRVVWLDAKPPDVEALAAFGDDVEGPVVLLLYLPNLQRTKVIPQHQVLQFFLKTRTL